MGKIANLSLLGVGGAEGSGPPPGPITATLIQNWVTDNKGFSGNSHTFFGLNVQDGKLVVPVMINVGSRSFVSVTIGGNAMTKVATNDAGGTSEVFTIYEYNWTGGTGTADLTITLSDSHLGVSACIYHLDDTGATVTDTAVRTSQFDGVDVQFNLNIPTDGVAVISVDNNANTQPTPAYSGTNCTIDNVLHPAGGVAENVVVAAQSDVVGSPTSITITETNAQNGNWGYIAVAYTPS